MDDSDLLQACLAGEETGWRYLQRITEVVLLEMGFVPRRLDIERSDVVQEVLLTLIAENMRALRIFQGRSSLKTYVRTIVRRVLSRLHRRQVKLYGTEDVEGNGEGGLSTEEQVVSSLFVEEMIKQHLSVLEQRVLFLDALGYTSAEIADILSRLENKPISPEVVRQRKSRAIRRLRKHLSHS